MYIHRYIYVYIYIDIYICLYIYIYMYIYIYIYIYTYIYIFSSLSLYIYIYIIWMRCAQIHHRAFVKQIITFEVSRGPWGVLGGGVGVKVGPRRSRGGSRRPREVQGVRGGLSGVLEGPLKLLCRGVNLSMIR